MATRWTPEQLAAIRTTGRSLLVSAAAGSGKTSVLAERCAHLVCDAEQRCGVNQLLVVTFTDAAAMEMKGRIEQTLRRRIEEKAAAGEDDAPLRRQASLVEHAAISTLHGFCSRLLRQHFHRVGLDPSFRVLAGEEQTLLRIETARDLFAQRYDGPDAAAAAAFQDFVDAFGDGRDEGLLEKVVGTYELLRSLVDPRAWMARARARIAEGATAPFDRCELGREYAALVAQRLADLERDCAAAAEAVERMAGEGAAPYAPYVRDVLLETARRWSRTLADDGYDALAAAVADAQIPSLPAPRNALPGKEQAKALVEPLKKQFTEGPLAKALRFSAAQWQAGLASVRPHAETFLDLIADFARRYAAAKAEARALDFADLERHALRLLCDGEPAPDDLRPSPVARLLHRQFQHVLVDEYQDINEVQDAILHLASRECLQGDGRRQPTATPNLFCVGDVKQSIYGFRLAEPGRFLFRRERFAAGDLGGQVIDLTSNFRSRKPLLDALNAVFERLMTRAAADIEYDASQRLVAGASFPPPPADGDADAECFAGAPIELHVVPRDPAAAPTADDESAGETEARDADAPAELERPAREALVIAQRIEQLMGRADGHRRRLVADRHQPGGGLRPVRFSDVVILLRATRFHAEQYAEILRRRGIPVFNDAGGGYFDAMEVRDVLSLLRILDNPRQDVALAAVLRSPLSGLPDPDDCLARVRLAFPPGRAAGPVAVPFHEAVARYARERDDELAAKLRDVLAELASLRQVARQRPVADLLAEAYERTGFLAFCSGLDNGTQRVANLLLLFEKARQFGTFSRQGLYRFIRFLEDLRAEADLSPAVEQGQADDVVRIMSVHRSKGLEFPVVFVPELGKAINFASAQGTILADRSAFLGMSAIDLAKQVRYPSLAGVLVSERLRRAAIAEELRVLYVALTRAREHLVLVGTAKEDAPERWERLWAGRKGPVPASTVLAARTMLDWLGPVSAMTVGPDGAAIEVYPHPADELAALEAQLGAGRPAADEARLAALARLQPLDPAPPLSAPADDAAAVIQRLTWQYPHAPFSTLPAARATTPWTKQPASASSAAHAPAAGTAPLASTAATLLPPPRFLLEQQALSAAERGTATHLFLQHLDHARPCDAADLEAQLASLVDRRLLLPVQAAAVDRPAILWYLDTPVGRLARRHAAVLLRELPLNLAVPAAEFDPRCADGATHDLDRVMVRGRIDLLVPESPDDPSAPFALVDHKTDRVAPGEALAERIALYRPQVALYASAVARITGRSVSASHLVFLAARHVETIA